ncbi:MAG TPA: hypothetical protein VN048_10050, partial [Verrucomicrobiae bacterium]|nr:hypothetical protein [Verrucomicrobiae bacterium]
MKKILFLAVPLLMLAFGAAANVLPPDQLLPDDTLVLITVPDYAKLHDIYNNSPQLQLWSDPAMKPFRDKFTDKLKSQFITPMEHNLGAQLDDYLTLLQGQITFALVQNGWQGDSDDSKLPALLFLIDTKDKNAQLKTDLATLKGKWVDSGRSVKTERIRNVDFSVITLSSNDVPESLKKAAGAPGDSSDSADKPADSAKGPKATVYIGQAESLLIVGNSVKVIEKVLAAMSGSDVRTLSQVPAYAANHDAMFRDAPVFGWVNAHALVEIGKHAAGGSSQSENSPVKIFSALGLDGLKTLAFDYIFTSDGAQGNFLIGV